MTEGGVIDVSAVNQMPRLESLALHVGKLSKNHIDLEVLPSLTTFAATWSSHFGNVIGGPRLGRVMLEKPKSDILRLLARNSEITSVDLRNARSEISLATEGGSSIRELKIAAATVGDWDEIAALERLEALELNDVKGLADLPSLGQLRLRRLVLEDCGPIPSVRFLSGTLEELILIGSTDVVDGDLQALADLRVLKGRRRRHYNYWR